MKAPQPQNQLTKEKAIFILASFENEEHTPFYASNEKSERIDNFFNSLIPYADDINKFLRLHHNFLFYYEHNVRYNDKPSVWELYLSGETIDEGTRYELNKKDFDALYDHLTATIYDKYIEHIDRDKHERINFNIASPYGRGELKFYWR